MCRSHSNRFVVCALFFFESFLKATSANCFYPNGTDVNLGVKPDLYLPCQAEDDVSMCCRLGGGYPNTCRSDGLCLSNVDRNVRRESCTDSSWQSPKCIKLCDTGPGEYPGFPDQADDNVMVMPCSDGSFCCGNGTIGEQCCSDKKGVFIVNGKTTNINPSGASSASSASAISTSSTASSAASSTPSSTLSSTFSSATSSGFSSSSAPSHHVGAITGGTIGGIIAVILVVGITIILTRRHMRKKQPEYLSGLKAELPTMLADASKDPTRFELETRPHRVEVDGGRIDHELQ